MGQTGRSGKEPQIERSVGCVGIQSGCYFRLEGRTREGTETSLDGMQLSIDLHPRGDETRGTYFSVQILHHVGRAGRFGTKGIAISFISSEQDQEVMTKVQSRFEVNIPELPDEIDVSTYMST